MKNIIIRVLRVVPDKMYLSIFYFFKMKKFMNWKNPKTYTQKAQWLKVYDRDPRYTKMVDKSEAKKHVADIIGCEYIIPTYGVWDNYDDIPFDELPDKFVIKPTHDSGSLIICRDKSKLNHISAKKKLESTLKNCYYDYGREWPYKGVKPRILVEEYMEESNSATQTLTDYKFFCFDGEPKIVMTVIGGHEDESQVSRQMYDPNWKLYEVGIRGKKFIDNPQPRPENLDKMLELARKLSSGHRHLRVDFYDINGKIYFGELTFFHMSGIETFVPKSFDKTFGDFINI